MRADLFDEKYLVTPISSIIGGVFGERVIAEFKHPVLNKHKNGPGRPPEIDFVVKDKSNKIKIAIESKWYGNSPVKVGDILWDLIRLELLHKEFSTQCFFVLGGKKKRLTELFSSKRFNESRPNGTKRPILRIDSVKKQSLRLDSPPIARAKLIMKRMMQYPDISMPSKIATRLPSYYPLNCKNADHQVFVWEVGSQIKQPRFEPKNNKAYH